MYQEIRQLVLENRIEEAIYKCEEALSSAEALPRETDSIRALILYDLGTLYLLCGNYAKAKPKLEQSVRLRHGKAPEEDPHLCDTMLLLAKTYTLTGDFDEAYSLFARTQEALEATVGPDDVSLAVCLTAFADLSNAKGDFTTAEGQLRRALDLKTKALPPNDASLLITQALLADTYRQMARYDEALSLCDALLLAARSSQGEVGAVLPRILAIKGKSLADIGRLSPAKAVFAECLSLQTHRLGLEHPDVADTLNSLAALAEISGDFIEAERQYDSSLRILESKLGLNHPTAAVTLGNMAVLHRKMGDFEKAVDCTMRSLEICRESFGENHPQTAIQLQNIASLLRETGRFEEAESLLLQSWNAICTAQGADSPTSALVMMELAGIYEDLGEVERAQQMYETSLGVRASRFGLDDPFAIEGLNNLGILYYRNGKAEQAIQFFGMAVQTAERTLGDEHPKIAEILNNMAGLEESRNHLDAAIQSIDRARGIVHSHLSNIFINLRWDEQVRFQELNDYPTWDTAMSLALEHRLDENAARKSAAWILNSKSVKARLFAQKARLLTEEQPTARGGVAKELAGVEQTLADLVVRGPQADETGQYQTRMDALEERRRRLLREIGVHRESPTDSRQWATLESVQSCLSDEAVLIEIVLVEPIDFRAERGKQRKDPRFMAWIITADQSSAPTIVDLGEAREIEAAIESVRMAVQNAPATVEADGEMAAEAKLRVKIKRLSDLVVAPLSEQLEKKPVWLISPDGPLWLVPWEMLLLNGDYIIAQHRIVYLTSGRELGTWPDYEKTQAPVVIADPDFDADLESDDSVASGENLKTENLAPRSSTPRIDFTSLFRTKWSRLPGTREEARRIIPVLSEYADRQEVVTLLGKDARESQVKRRVTRPSVLVASTHGFFVPMTPRFGQDASSSSARGIGGVLEDRDRPDDEDTVGLHKIVASNPLLQCGLVLAGANRRYVSGDDDGILTGLEAALLDLVGTKLVVLSACDTGVGELFVGDGVSSLRQAFLAAGAENVVASLWKVPDEETADLVSDFVKRFADGQGVAEALRQAQLDTIAERRANSGAAHPFYWASFTSTGRWRYPNRFQYQQLGDGVWMLEERWPDGSIKMRSSMRANELGSLVRDGKFSQWYKNGQQKVDGQFRNGREDGQFIEWHEGGVKASENTYLDGVLSGPFTDWNSNGKPTIHGQYVDDRLSGTVTTWDDETGYRTEIEYSGGRMDGAGVMYNRAGTTVLESHYKQGLLHGTRTYFSEDGEKFHEIEYANGIVLEHGHEEDE